jgi:hypothetical protein
MPLLGTAAASVTTVIPLTYLPMFIGFSVASAPTSLQININGDGITFNMDSTGLTAMNNIRQLGTIATTYIYQLSNGLVKNKVGTLTFANSAAASVSIYGWSPFNTAQAYCVYTQQNVLANSGATFNRFAYMAFPSAAASDAFIINYNDGGSDNVSRNELNFNLPYTQDSLASRYNIDNINPARISQVTFIPAAAQNVYQMNYQAVNGGGANPTLLGRG